MVFKVCDILPSPDTQDYIREGETAEEALQRRIEEGRIGKGRNVRKWKDTEEKVGKDGIVRLNSDVRTTNEYLNISPGTLDEETHCVKYYCCLLCGSCNHTET